MTNKNPDKSTWAVGGGLLSGLGAGFFVLEKSALLFVGCIIIGLGSGLITAAIISAIKGGESLR